MIGTLQQVFEDMEDGVYDFTKDGKCSSCGACCANYLPLSSSEIKEIKRCIKKHHIKEQKHTIALTVDPVFDMTCSFLDTSREKEKCTIYSMKPKICSVFQCDQPPSKVKENKELFWRTRKPCDMRETFFGEE